MGTKRAVNRKKVHRSFTLPAELVEEALRVVPPQMADNLNRLVVVSLTKLVESCRREEFEREMARMAADPALVKSSDEMTEGFKQAEADGL